MFRRIPHIMRRAWEVPKESAGGPPPDAHALQDEDGLTLTDENDITLDDQS